MENLEPKWIRLLSEVARRNWKIRSFVIKWDANKTATKVVELDWPHVSEKSVATRIKGIRTKTDTGG